MHKHNHMLKHTHSRLEQKITECFRMFPLESIALVLWHSFMLAIGHSKVLQKVQPPAVIHAWGEWAQDCTSAAEQQRATHQSPLLTSDRLATGPKGRNTHKHSRFNYWRYGGAVMLAELQLAPRVTVSKPAGTVPLSHSLYLPTIFVSVTSATLFFWPNHKGFVIA